VDVSIDDADKEIAIWDYLSQYCISDKNIHIYTKLSKFACIGNYFNCALYNEFLGSYDIIINFIHGHEEASKLIKSTIQYKFFVEKIIAESQKNVMEAERYKLT